MYVNTLLMVMYKTIYEHASTPQSLLKHSSFMKRFTRMQALLKHSKSSPLFSLRVIAIPVLPLTYHGHYSTSNAFRHFRFIGVPAIK